ncbi:MAG TPA: LiaF domain-containing protein [Candidatus Limnocylindrales bacterium]
MRLIRNLVGLVIFGAIASAVGAAIAKSRLVSSGGEADDEFDLVTIYDSLAFESHAPAFRRGSVLTWYGGGTLDLRGATLDPGGATLGVRALFGGLQLVVPPDWRVEQDVTAVFGGIGDVRGSAADAADGPVLRLTGWCVFGGVGIVSEAAGGGDAFEPTGAPDETEPAPAMA